MNYKKIYNQIITRGQNRNLIGYKEKHHIIPRCLGGIDENNIVELTAKEHFICHKLLTEIYPTETKLHHAVWIMINGYNKNRKYKIGSREYQRLKENIVFTETHRKKLSVASMGNTRALGRIVSKETRRKISESNLGQTRSEETKKKISESLTGKTHSEETRKKMSKSKKGILRTEEEKRKISETLKGHKMSDETRRKISESLKRNYKNKK